MRRQQVDDDALDSLNRGVCPVCHYRGFVLGPKGGLNQNIECGNLSCRTRFNVALFSGRIMSAQRIEKRSEGGIAWPSEPLR